MKKGTKTKIKSITHDILDLFLGIPESTISAFNRKEFYRIMQGYPADRILTCSNIAQLLRNLKRSGYIEVEKTRNGSESIRFTNKARLAIVDRVVSRMPEEKKYYFVSFDIPELLRVSRNRFRRMIRKMGFVQIQKSLWVCDKGVGRFVELAACEYGVEPFVVYFASISSNIDKIAGQKLSQNKSSALSDKV